VSSYYNSIIDSNYNKTIYEKNGEAFYVLMQYSLVNSLVINSGKISTQESGSYIVNSILSNSDISGGSVNIINSYVDSTLSGTHFDTNVISSGDLGFVDAANGDYRLSANSVLVDAGTLTSNAVDIPYVDFDGNARVSGGDIDIGPFELAKTRPVLYDFNYTGNATEFNTLTFSVSYTLEGNRTMSDISYDYTNSGSWTSDNTHTFNTEGTYTVKVKVTDDTGEFSTRSLSVTIAPLAFSAMTDEQKIKKAVAPQYYDQIMAIINAKGNAENASAVTVGENNVILDPASYNLVTQTAYNTALTDMNTTATATGENLVIASPSAYGLISSTELNSSVATAQATGVTSGKQYVKDHPSEFGLVTKSDLDITATNISSLQTGWTLMSTPFAITDMSIFDSASII